MTKLTSDLAVDDVHSCLAHVVFGRASARLRVVTNDLADGTDVAVVGGKRETRKTQQEGLLITGNRVFVRNRI